MENEKKKVLFDPGYASVVMDAIGQVGYIYYTFSAIPNLKLKKLNFPSTLAKIEKYLKTNIAFYLGCILWASYISGFENCEIEGNKLLGENCEEAEYTNEINFLIDLIENKLQRDSKYFLGKDYKTNEKYIPILKAYREFLISNKGFCNCSNTSQIILPNNIKKLNKEELDNINSKIQTAIKNKNIDTLLDEFNLLF